MTNSQSTRSASSWSGAVNPQYNTYQYPTQQVKTEASSTGIPLRMESSASNPDAISALIGIISTNINTSFTDLKSSISDVKIQNESNNKEINDKIDKINNKSLAEKIFEPSTIAILSIVVLILACLILGSLSKFTGTSMSELKDYILLFGGGLVGFLGSDKIKKSESK